jgi:hypothetical protein
VLSIDFLFRFNDFFRLVVSARPPVPVKLHSALADALPGEFGLFVHPARGELDLMDHFLLARRARKVFLVDMNPFAWIVVQAKPLLPVRGLVADHPTDVGDLSSLGSPKGFGKGFPQALAGVGNRVVNAEMSLSARLFWHGSFPLEGASTPRLYHNNAESLAKPDKTAERFSCLVTTRGKQVPRQEAEQTEEHDKAGKNGVATEPPGLLRVDIFR